MAYIIIFMVLILLWGFTGNDWLLALMLVGGIGLGIHATFANRVSR